MNKTEGWKLVPIEPTEAMCRKGAAHTHRNNSFTAMMVYQAMLAAAPQVPTDDERVRELPAYGIIDPDYARVFTKARCIAWQYGYAVLMNGSFTRDLDLLLVPWTDQASRSISPQYLIQRICSTCQLRENGHPPTSKPHGRTAYTLLFNEFGDPRFIDISFIPAIASMSGEQG